MKDGDFRYIEETHSYFLGDRRLIGVSEVIQAGGLKNFAGIPKAVLEHARARGVAIHAACQYLDENDLDWATVRGTEIEPYVVAWQKFTTETGMTFEEIEVPHFNAALGIAGRPDRKAVWNGKRGLVDLKSYKPDPVTGIQLAGYQEMTFDESEPIFRIGVGLDKKGKYKVVSFGDRTDRQVFLSCLAIAKRQQGVA